VGVRIEGMFDEPGMQVLDAAQGLVDVIGCAIARRAFHHLKIVQDLRGNGSYEYQGIAIQFDRVMSPLMVAHVIAGAVGLVSGAAALSVRKGERWHRAFGSVFFASMLVMAATGAYLAVLQPHSGTVIVGVLTFYFVVTAWTAARRKHGLGIFERVAFLVPASIAATLFMYGFRAANSEIGKFDDLEPTPYFLVGTFAAFIAALDLSLVLRGGVSGRQRIARHVWRMCTALSFGAGFFFLGQQEVLPALIRGSPVLFVPSLVPLALLAYWALRVLFTNWWKDDTGTSPRLESARN